MHFTEDETDVAFLAWQQPLHEAFGPAREVQPISNLEHSVTLIKKWIKTCDESHHVCLSLSSCLPDRVISITGDQPALIETNGDMTGEYITVSHSWGTAFGRKPMMTTKDNIDSHRQGIPWDILPILFRDFLHIAQSLKISYVWIDSLCIVQDDVTDWQHQAIKMGEYYANGYLNLAASMLQDSSQSLFSTRWHPDKQYYFGSEEFTTKSISTGTICTSPSMEGCCVRVRIGNMGVHQYVKGLAIRGIWKINPLLERAWVFQEQMLSRRTVHFGSSEMILGLQISNGLRMLLSGPALESSQRCATENSRC